LKEIGGKLSDKKGEKRKQKGSPEMSKNLVKRGE
jgi:hypothetical protein